MDRYDIRPIEPGDSLDDLTSMLHRAFGALARLGLHCESFEQSIDVTAARIARGECFVALYRGRLVGTMTLEPPDPASACPIYTRADVASLHQFAVDPSLQGLGCGHALLSHALDWAREKGYRELALDTPAAARHLIHFYEQYGFEVVQCLRMPGRNYLSAVLSRPWAAGLSAPPVLAGSELTCPRATTLGPNRSA